MPAPQNAYFEMIQECERLIGECRRAMVEGDKEAMGEAYMELLERVRPILIKRANTLRGISEGAVREALDEMLDRLWTNLTSRTFPSMQSHFGAYLRSMTIRILRKVREKYQPSDVSLQIENLDAHVPGQPPKGELLADPHSSGEIERLATRLDLQAALDRLPPDERQVIRQRMAGEENNAIAKSLGVSAATASRVYRRALDRLGGLLQAYEEGGAP